MHVSNVKPEPPSHKLSSELGLRTLLVTAAGLLPCSASFLQRSGADHTVQDRLAKLPCLRDGLHAVHTGQLGLVQNFCHHCLLPSCSEFVRHRFLPGGHFVLVPLLHIRWRALWESVDTLGSLLILFSFTSLPRDVRRTSVAGSLPPWTSLSTRMISLMRFLTKYCRRDSQLRLELRQSGQCVYVAVTSAFRVNPEDNSGSHRAVRRCVHAAEDGNQSTRGTHVVGCRTLLLELLRTALLRHWRVR